MFEIDGDDGATTSLASHVPCRCYSVLVGLSMTLPLTVNYPQVHTTIACVYVRNGLVSWLIV